MAWLGAHRFVARPLFVVGVLLAALPMLATLLLLGAMTPASAQGLDWFGGLFSGGMPRPRPGAPAYPGYGYGYGRGGGVPNSYYYARPRRHVPRRKAVEQVQKEAPAKEKAPAPKNASVFVYVFGDNFGQLLANGLDDALVDRQDVAVIHDARAGTGLVATNRYDWPKTIADTIAGRDLADEGADKAHKPDQKDDPRKTKDGKPKIDVAVMMVGLNDRQAIEIDGKVLKQGTPEWIKAYTKRVTEIDEAFRAKNIPLVWVGVPIMKDDDVADDMAAFNDIYRDAAAKTGAIFVDTWEAFSDDDGDFSAYGPDINGQTVRLRSADGTIFTKAGRRKLAHFVETHVRRALEGKTPPPQLPTAAAPDAQSKAVGDKPVAVVAKPEAGPIRNLNELPTAADGTLATLQVKSAMSGNGVAESALVHGAAIPIPAGRADNAHWSGKGPLDP